MAVSGSIQTNTSFGYVRLSWSTQSQNISNNTSTIEYTLSIYRSSSISSTAQKNYSIVFNGATVSSGTTTIGGSGTKTIRTGTTTITHNGDGTKSFSYSFSQQIDITWSGSTIGSITGSGTGTLDTIPRATTPTLSASSADMGTNITINTPRTSLSFTHTLTYSFGSTSGTIATGVTTSSTWSIPLSLASQIPNATSGVCTITCKTYNGSTLIGTKTVSLTITVTSSVVPIINSVNVSEAIASITTTFNSYIQHKSKLNIAAVANGSYSSSINSYRVTIRDYDTDALLTQYIATDISTITTSGSTITTDLLSWNSLKLKIGVIVTDSRGRSASVVYSNNGVNYIDVLPYESPKITTFTAYRADSSGNPDYEGERLNFTINFNITPLNNLNAKYYEVVYRQKGTTTWLSITSGNVYSYNSTLLSSAVFSGDNAYDVALNLWDTFNASATTVQLDIPTAFTLVDFRGTGKGIAFGKVSEKDEMEIALDVDLTGKLLQEDKIAPTLLNSWVNYGGSYETSSYWKDKCGVVHLGGLVKSGSITDGTVIFTLPTGYRPRLAEKFITVSLNAICIIDIYANGNVTIRAGANAGWLSLSGISFKAV